ncbi:50S ribosomal protein L11 methyltransferase [Mesorhizobium australicum]|uniref:glycosyltransferase n=1 Tax=Mesorhizobium australicum TaxID=536018 RepID=UPI00333B9BC8
MKSNAEPTNQPLIKTHDKLIHFIDLDESEFQTKDLDLHKYLAIRSAHAVNPMYLIYLHCNYSPHGLLWNTVKTFTQVKPTHVDSDIRFNNINRIEHKADLLRLIILDEFGGIYLDTDIISLKPFDTIAASTAVMGKEQRYLDGPVLGLCNAVILAPKGSEFVRLWLKSYEGFHNEQWSEFSVQIPWRLAQQYPDLIELQPATSFFYPNGWPEGIYSLFGSVDEYPEAYTFHLWRSASREYLDRLSPERICNEDTTLNIAVRRYIKDDFRYDEGMTSIDLLTDHTLPRPAHLLEMVFRNTNMTVQSGPFQGMRLARRAMWADGDLCAKLFGTYESELHSIITLLTGQLYDAIVDIGCADGFYAVGFAKLFAGTPVYAFDYDETAQRITAENAIGNSLGTRIQVGGLLSAEQLIEIASNYGRLLVFTDIEGSEKQLLGNGVVANALSSSDLIIETHDFRDRTITPAIWEKYSETHKIEVIHHAGRDPHAIPFLSNMSEINRWKAVCEYRENNQHWLFCRSRNPSDHLTRKLQSHLVTAHGTVLYIENISRSLQHGFPDRRSIKVTLLCEGASGKLVYERGGFRYPVICQEGGSFAIAEQNPSSPTIFEIVRLNTGEIGLRAGDAYLCAESNGQITLSRPHLRGWECFRCLPTVQN